VFTQYALQKEDWPYIADMLGMVLPNDLKGLIAFKNEDTTPTVAAVVVLSNWTANTVDVSWVINDPLILRHGFFEAGYEFVFEECDIEHIIGRIAGKNTKSLKLAHHMGMKELAVIPNGYGTDNDLHILSMCKDDFYKGRWFKERAA
jgi:RimJ/RimL family protein N-acetyltransferase